MFKKSIISIVHKRLNRISILFYLQMFVAAGFLRWRLAEALFGQNLTAFVYGLSSRFLTE